MVLSKSAKFIRWDENRLDKMRGGMTRSFITMDTVMLAQVRFKVGDYVPPHRHENEQITTVISGVMKFRFGDDQDEVVIVGANEAVMIPSNLLHSAEILEDVYELDVFSPPRQDWIDGTDDYLRDK